jgi:aromatic ring-opening dioxygenase catalytic subunit (LigB family)
MVFYLSAFYCILKKQNINVGFPDYTYKLTYPAPHSPQLVDRVKSLLGNAKFEVEEDKNRGLDHGVFIPLKLIYPDAEIPVVQLSLHSSLDPKMHFEIGRALAPLRSEV